MNDWPVHQQVKPQRSVTVTGRMGQKATVVSNSQVMVIRTRATSKPAGSPVTGGQYMYTVSR